LEAGKKQQEKFWEREKINFKRAIPEIANV
jgi:hypothetical protein